MRVLFDALALPPYGGARTSALGWIRNVVEVGADHEFVVVVSDHEVGLEGMDNLHQVVAPVSDRLGIRLWAQAQLPRLTKTWDVDIVHFTKNHATFLLSCPTVLTVNDLNRLHYPAMFSRIDVLYWKTIQPMLLQRMTKVIAISKNTQRDLQHFYQLSDERIQVIYPAISPRFQSRETLGPQRVSEVLSKYAIRPPYVLSVGGMAVHKNVYTALSAFYTLLERGHLVDHSFVIVGDRVHTHNDRRLFELAEQHQGRNVHFTGLVDDEDLPVLYAGADLFVYPSLYEGFGLSPLEAMACGVPVLASAAGSLVEVLADSAWLVERATDVEAVAEGMRAILTNRETWENFRERGFKNVSRFSWRETARQTLALYRQIV